MSGLCERIIGVFILGAVKWRMLIGQRHYFGHSGFFGAQRAKLLDTSGFRAVLNYHLDVGPGSEQPCFHNVLLQSPAGGA